MKFNGTITSISVKVDHSGNIIERVILEVEQGTLQKISAAMRQALVIDLEPRQMIIGEK